MVGIAPILIIGAHAAADPRVFAYGCCNFLIALNICWLIRERRSADRPVCTSLNIESESQLKPLRWTPLKRNHQIISTHNFSGIEMSCNMPKNKFLSRATAIVVIGPRQIGKPTNQPALIQHHFKQRLIIHL